MFANVFSYTQSPRDHILWDVLNGCLAFEGIAWQPTTGHTKSSWSYAFDSPGWPWERGQGWFGRGRFTGQGQSTVSMWVFRAVSGNDVAPPQIIINDSLAWRETIHMSSSLGFYISKHIWKDAKDRMFSVVATLSEQTFSTWKIYSCQCHLRQMAKSQARQFNKITVSHQWGASCFGPRGKNSLISLEWGFSMFFPVSSQMLITRRIRSKDSRWIFWSLGCWVFRFWERVAIHVLLM